MESEYVCTNIASFKHVITERRAMGAALIITFICYTLITVISELKKNTKLGQNLKKQVNEMGYGQIFFFLGMMAAIHLTPRVFAAFLAYLYLITFVVQTLAYVIEKPVLNMVASIVQMVLMLILYIYLMADKWCGYFHHR